MPTLDEELEALSPIPSRFARLMTPGNFLDEIMRLKQQQAAIDKRVRTGRTATVYQPAKSVIGTVKGDHQYEAELHFGEVPAPDAPLDEAVAWTEPLVDPDPSKDHYVRLRIAQHMVDPMLQGFTTKWTAPAGWTWTDGLGTILHDEAISNPLIITRRVHPPASIDKVGFRVAITARYLP